MSRISVRVRNRIEDLADYRPYLTDVLQECDVPLVWGATWMKEFIAWFTNELQTKGIDRAFHLRLAEAAADQVRMTAVGRFIGTKAWSAAEPQVHRLDAAFLGSLGRCEAGSSSDFDILFAGVSAAELKANGVDVADIEARRAILMRARPWCTTFRDACIAEGYDFPEHPKPDIRVIAPQTEFYAHACVVSSDDRTGHAANYLAAGYDLRAGAAFAELVDYGKKQGSAKHGEHRLQLIHHYLDNANNDGRAHSAHGFVTQAWQAILFFTKRPLMPRTPYWKVPLILPLASRASQQAWHDAMTELYIKRRSNGIMVDGFVADGVAHLARCAVAFGLDPSVARQILLAADPSAVL